MPESFYAVLGVGPDADSDEIRRSNRERAKECHPDVSNDPDSTERFKRLTSAKKTLLDTTQRQRYDDLGHNTYMRLRRGCPGWRQPDDARDSEPSADEYGDSAPEESSSEHRRSAGRYRSATEQRTRKRTRSDGGRTVNRTIEASARGSFWDEHRQTGIQADPQRRPDIPRWVLDKLGGWLVLDALLLALALGTAWIGHVVAAADGAPSLPVYLVLGREVGITVVLVVVHVISKLSR